MTPVITTANIYTPPPTLVATVVPGNNTLRINADNVPPPVSSLQINNYNKNNGSTVIPQGQTQTPAGSAGGFSLSPFIYITPTSLSAGAQNTFVAQLMSQDNSAQAQGLLEGYEQIVAYGNVKYLPSNASLPEPEPANVFGRILQQERQAATAQIVNNTQQAAATKENINTHIATVSAPKEAASPSRSDIPERPAANTVKSNPAPRTASAVAIHAYLAVAARNDAASRKKSDEPIEAI